MKKGKEKLVKGQYLDAAAAKAIDPNIKPGFAIVNKLEIKQILSEEEARKLRPSPTLSIGLVLVPVRLIKGSVQVMTISEHNDYNPQRLTTKFPSITMKARDESFESALSREGIGETDHYLDDFEFVCAAEYSSITSGQQHYKVCFLAKEQAPASLRVERIPTEEIKFSTKHMILKRLSKKKLYHPKEQGIESADWRLLQEVEKLLPRSQKTLFGPIVQKVMKLSKEYWFRTPNLTPQYPFQEGEYQTKLHQPF